MQVRFQRLDALTPRFDLDHQGAHLIPHEPQGLIGSATVVQPLLQVGVPLIFDLLTTLGDRLLHSLQIDMLVLEQVNEVVEQPGVTDGPVDVGSSLTQGVLPPGLSYIRIGRVEGAAITSRRLDLGGIEYDNLPKLRPLSGNLRVSIPDHSIISVVGQPLLEALVAAILLGEVAPLVVAQFC